MFPFGGQFGIEFAGVAVAKEFHECYVAIFISISDFVPVILNRIEHQTAYANIPFAIGCFYEVLDIEIEIFYFDFIIIIHAIENIYCFALSSQTQIQSYFEFIICHDFIHFYFDITGTGTACSGNSGMGIDTVKIITEALRHIRNCFDIFAVIAFGNFQLPVSIVMEFPFHIVADHEVNGLTRLNTISAVLIFIYAIFLFS